MDSSEVQQELKMTYNMLVEHLLKKYGPAKYDYFRTESCKSKNPKVFRGDEGLCCHHIDEDKAIMLSNDKFAPQNPFKYQKAERLVYGNVLEHLILHIKIFEEPRNKNANKTELQGMGGAVIMCTQINDFYNGYEYKQQRFVNLFAPIKDNFEDYIMVLKYFLNVASENPLFQIIVSKERLSTGWDGQIVKKVYGRL